MLARAGVRDVDVRVVQAAGREPDVKLMPALTLENTIDAVVGAGLAGREAVEAMVDELYALAADPAAVLALPRVVQAWGRVPLPALNGGQGRGRVRRPPVSGGAAVQFRHM